jgi:hypothetical protein
MRNLMCGTCGLVFCEKARLVAHMTEHKDAARPFACNHCHLRYTSERKRMEHMEKKHMDLFPVPCGFCHMRFLTEDKRAVHIRHMHMAGPYAHVEHAPVPYLHDDGEIYTSLTDEEEAALIHVEPEVVQTTPAPTDDVIPDLEALLQDPTITFLQLSETELAAALGLTEEDFSKAFAAPATAPATAPAAEPAAEPVTEPAAEPATAPAAEPVAQPQPKTKRSKAAPAVAVRRSRRITPYSKK